MDSSDPPVDLISDFSSAKQRTPMNWEATEGLVPPIDLLPLPKELQSPTGCNLVIQDARSISSGGKFGKQSAADSAQIGGGENEEESKVENGGRKSKEENGGKIKEENVGVKIKEENGASDSKESEGHCSPKLLEPEGDNRQGESASGSVAAAVLIPLLK